MISDTEYKKKTENEKRYFGGLKNFSALPQINHWWADRYLRPRMQEVFGFSGGNSFYLKPLTDAAATRAQVRAISLGSGDGEVELALGKALKNAGIENVQITGMEMSEDLVAKANKQAHEAGLGSIVEFQSADLNKTFGLSNIDFVLANQVLHHLVNLEDIYDNCLDAMADHGVLMTRDMVGKNGHQAWPEAKVIIDDIWQNMPQKYRFNNRQQILCDRFPNTDFSVSGFEGIRAQNVLPLLNERFGYSAFYAFGGIVERFMNRGWGANYSSDNENDLSFIANLQVINDILLDSGQITPTQICAYFTKAQTTGKHWKNRSPQNSARR